ncbi:hypothetical protein [Sphingomonas molluscorum]
MAIQLDNQSGVLQYKIYAIATMLFGIAKPMLTLDARCQIIEFL